MKPSFPTIRAVFIRRKWTFFSLLLFALVSNACADEAASEGYFVDEYGVAVGPPDENGKTLLEDSGWEEPTGKEDALRGSQGLPVSVDTQPTAVWEVKNAWSDTTTAAARKAGMAWPADSGLTWEDKFHRWVGSLPRVQRAGYGETFEITTPYGVVLPAPVLECAEVAMFLRIAFASWYNLPFFMEGTDSQGRRLYFGHFGVRTANGRFGNMPNFKSQYRDYSNLAEAIKNGEAQWPTDSNLAGRRIPGARDDAQPFLGDERYAGAYFDSLFLNKRVGYFLLLHMVYFGSISLASPVNTFHIEPESLRAGDTLVHRWQRNGIGHALVVMRSRDLGTTEVDGVELPQMEAEVASGSMPRRQPLWESPAASKRNFVNQYAGGGDYVSFNGGVKRWRSAAKVQGRWTNVVADQFADYFISARAQDTLKKRPQRYQDILTELEPREKLNAMAEIVESARVHLRNYPASCAARRNREAAFRELYSVGEEVGMTREEIDRDYRKFEDYVFAELIYQESKTCCWNSSTSDMYDLVMAYNMERREDPATGQCLDATVFKARNDGADGFALFREYAREVGKEHLWRTWSADESCPQATTREDKEVEHEWTPQCTVFDGNSNGGTEYVTYSNEQRVDIPDQQLFQNVTSDIEVQTRERRVKSMTIDLDIRHTYRGDLLVKLYKEDDSVIIFDGFASASPSSHDVILTGEVVEGFEGYLAEGTWTLSIIDRLNGDVGYLNYWALNFELE